MALLCLTPAALALPEANAQTVNTSPVPSTGTSPFNTTNVNNILALGGIAVDSSGNVFVGAINFNSTGNGEIMEFTPTTTTPPFTYPNSSHTNITINTAGTPGTANKGCNLPNRLPGDSNPNVYGEINQLTVDKNDTIWIADNSGPVWEIAKGSTTATCNTNISDTASSNTLIPAGIAVDSNLNVFVSDNSNNVIREYLNSETYSTAHTFFTAPSGELGALAIDSQDNLYVVNTINNTVEEFKAENPVGPTVIFSVNSPEQLNSVSALPNGDLIVIDNGGDDNGPAFVAGHIFKLTPASPTFTSTTLTLSPATPSGFDADYAATDSSGDVFVGETSWVVINTCGGTPCANTTSIVQFSLGAGPTVSSLSPASGSSAGDTSVTITGTNFTSPATVKFGANAATDVNVVSATEITAVSPAGSGTVDVTVTTGAGTSQTSASDQFTYDVSGPTAATAISSEILTANHAASFTPVTASGGAAPLSYSVSPSLPSGLHIASTTGVVSGTPTVTLTATSFTVTVTDQDSQTATASFDLTINPAVTAAQAIASETLVQNQSATPFTPVTGSGGTGTLTYTIAPALPGGLSIASTTGAISGTPAAGSPATTYTVTVTDSNGATASQTFVLTVLAVPTVILPTASPINFGQSLMDSILSGGSAASAGVPVPGSFAFATPTTVPPVGTHSEAVIFTPTNTLEFATVGNNVSVTVNPPNYAVNTNQDDAAGTASNCTGSPEGTCTLRDALEAASEAGGANITFSSTAFPAPSGATITLTNGTLSIPSNTTIQGLTTGSGATLTNLVTVSGNNSVQVLNVASGVTGAVINNLVVTEGSNSSGGGIGNSGTLTVTNCTFSGNSAPSGGEGGGAIFNNSLLTVTDSTFSGNSAVGASVGGAIDNTGPMTLTNSTFSGNSASGAVGGGALFNNNLLTVTNSTFSGNSATGEFGGGGISSFFGTLAVTNSTFSGNSAPSGNGGAIFTTAGTAGIGNNIFVGNSAADDSVFNSGSTFTDRGFNVFFNNTGGDTNFSAAISDIIGSDPMLAPLGNYGGPTQTMIPLPGSSAICAASQANIPNGITTDERGFPNTNNTYSGFTTTPCVDAGAVQTNYSVSFSTEPGSAQIAGQRFQAAVTLDESGSAFTGGSVSLPLTLMGNGVLSGGTASTSTTTGIASFSALQVSAAGTGDQLTATLALNSGLTPAPAISAASLQFNVAQLTPTFSFTPSPASQIYGAAVASTSLDATASSSGSTVTGTFVFTTTVNGNTITITPGTTVLPVGNYTITASFTPANTATFVGGSATASYTVNAASLTAAITASNKTYNANTVATVSCSLSGVVPADTGNVACTPASASFATKNVGTGLTVTATGISLSGIAATNYTLSSTSATTTANITVAPLTITAVANSKTYDSTTSAAAVPTVGAGQLQGSDSVTGLAETYSTASAGTGKTLSVSADTVNDGNGGNNYRVTTVANNAGVVTAASVSANVTASNKTYNGTTAATVSCSLAGVLPADTGNVTCSAASANFATASAGNGITVTANGITLSGNAAGNYTLTSTSATATANITADSVSANVTASNKTYNGTTAATLSSCTLTGVVAADTGNVTCSAAAATFATASAGNGITVTATGITLSGSAAGNYTLASTSATATANITRLSVTAGVTASNKTYNANTVATVSCSVAGVVPADMGNVTCSAANSTFATKNVGTGISVSASGIALGGSAAGNYTLASTTAAATANITAAPLTLTAAANSKTFDGTTSAAAVPTVGAGQLQGSDSVTGLAETYSTATVGTGKTLTVSADTVNDGNGGNNYQLNTVANNAGVITAAAVTASVSASNKTYNASTVAAIGSCSLAGLLPADTGNVACSAASASFATKNVGTGLTVTATGISLSGIAATNYTLSSTSATTTANITVAPLTITAVANSKTYDSTTGAAAVPTVGAGQLQGSDSVTGLAETYSTASAGTGKTLNVSADTVNDGNGGDNYRVTKVANNAGVVTAASVSANVTASNKTYNGTTAATVSCSLAGVLPADTGNVTCSAASANFATASAGNGITVTANGITLSGNAAGNYTLTSTSATTTANITAATLDLTANNASRIYGTANPVFTGGVTGQQNGDTFTEGFSTTATIASPVNTYAIVPSVTGTNLADYAQSIANGTLTVTKAGTTTAMTASSGSITPGQSVTLRAQVSSVTTGTPTGTVSFYDGTALLSMKQLAAGAASYSTAALAPGITHNISVTYSGDTNFTGSTNTMQVSVAVAPLDFTMAISGPSTASVVPGNSISYQVNVTPDYGAYAGTVNFTANGLPPGATVTFSPSSIAADGGPQTITVGIKTAPATAASHAPPPSSAGRTAPFALAFLLLFGAGSLRKRGRAIRRLFSIMALLAGGACATLTLSGCGAANGFFTQAPQNYTITIAATAGGLQHTTTVTLNEQ